MKRNGYEKYEECFKRNDFYSGFRNLDLGYDLAGLSQHMDFLNIMTYDMHGAWSPAE